MYLVELRPGKEELYRTGDDLALAIRDGDVDARSRIYHRATAKWISITLHPQYKAIVAGQTDEPLTRPARKAWGLFPTGLTGQGAEMSSSDAEAAGGSVRHRWKRPMGLGLAGLLLVLGIQLASSGPRPPWAGGRTKTAAITRHQRPAAVVNLKEDTELISLASSTMVWPTTAEPASNTIALPTPVEVVPVALPRAPRLRTKALRSALPPNVSTTKQVKANSVEALLRGYETASDEVGARLEGGMRVARLNRLFARGRLSPGGGVTDTRRSLAGAVNFIRVYRQQQAASRRRIRIQWISSARRTSLDREGCA